MCAISEVATLVLWYPQEAPAQPKGHGSLLVRYEWVSRRGEGASCAVMIVAPIPGEVGFDGADVTVGASSKR